VDVILQSIEMIDLVLRDLIDQMRAVSGPLSAPGLFRAG
jgi:hypothetical protein